MCYHPGAGRIRPQCRSPTRQSCSDKAAPSLKAKLLRHRQRGLTVENPSPCASAAAHLMKTVKSQRARAKLVTEVTLSYLLTCHQTSITLPGSISQSCTNLTRRCRPDGDSFPCKWQRKKSTMCFKAQAGGTKFSLFLSLAHTATLLRASHGETANSRGHGLCLGDTFYILNPRTLIAL